MIAQQFRAPSRYIREFLDIDSEKIRIEGGEVDGLALSLALNVKRRKRRERSDFLSSVIHPTPLERFCFADGLEHGGGNFRFALDKLA